MRLASAVLALVGCAVAIPTSGPTGIPGSNPCTRGPAFWCATLDNAEICNAYAYCVEHVWKNAPTPTSRLHNDPFQQLANLDPALLPERGLVAVVQDSVFKAVRANDDCDCEVCEWLVQQFDTVFRRNSTQSLIEQYYGKLCLNLPEPMIPECSKTLEKHFMLLTSSIGKIDPKKACKDVCLAGAFPTAALQGNLSPPVNTCLCQVCQQAMKDIDMELMKSTVQQYSIQEFVRYCGYVSPASTAAKCESEARQYIPELYSMLSHMDPLRTCNRFAFCQNASARPPSKKPTRPPVVKATTKHHLHIPCLSPDFVVQLVKEEMPAPPNFRDTCECESCKYYIGQFNACLKRNSTQSMIDTFYHKLCMNLPPPMQAQCTDVVHKHFASLIHDISTLDPDKACKADCQPHAKAERSQLNGDSINMTCLCKECHAVITAYASRMADASEQQTAVDYFDDICHFLPNDEGMQACRSTAKKYLPEFMTMLSHIDPGRTCNHFKYCQKAL